MSIATRTRTTTWDDPLATFERASGLSGLEIMAAIRDGELPPPPIAQTMGFAGLEAAEGSAAFLLDPGEYHYNPIGSVHGGVIATLLDSAMGCAVHTTLGAGQGYGTVDLHVRYVRPITVATGRIRAEGTVTHRGSRMATADGRLVAEATGKLLATATTSCMLLG